MISTYFSDYKNVQTPVETSKIKKKKEWDDDLKIHDIVIGKAENDDTVLYGNR